MRVGTRRSRSSNTGVMIRLLIGLAIAAFSLFSYFASSQFNDITGENQHVSITPQQEIALGYQTAPELVREFGGVSDNGELRDLIEDIGQDLVRNSIAADTPWEFQFTVLESDVINAFALPGGPVFITEEMIAQLDGDVDALAGVLAHEIVHVLARHGAQRIAQSQLTNGLIGAVAVASGDADAAQTAAVIAQLINLQYGREDELQSDAIGVCLLLDAGYDADGMIEVQETLEEVSRGERPPEFLSSHPNPGNRIAEIEEAIANADEFCPE